MAQQGIPAQSYNNQLNNIGQNQATAISRLSSSANPGANLASIVRAGDAATNQLNAQDAITRNQNMLNLLQQRTALAQQKEKAWDWNSQQKYLSLLAKSQALKGAGLQNINSGINDLGSIGGTVAQMGGFGGGGSNNAIDQWNWANGTQLQSEGGTTPSANFNLPTSIPNFTL